MDYGLIQTAALRAISSTGRTVTLYGPDSTPRDPARPDTGKEPLSGPGLVTIGVFVPMTGLNELGASKSFMDRAQTSGKVFLTGHVTTANYDYDAVAFVRDNGKTYVVEAIETLEPGDTPLLHYYAVKE